MSHVCVSRRAALRWVAVAALILAAAAGLVGWLAYRARPQLPPPPSEPVVDRHLPPDPRLTYTGPFRNIHPDVSYVGDDVCSDCHLDKAKTYREHPMGRSLLPISRLAASQRYDKAQNNPFDALGSRFTVERDGDRVYQRRIAYDDAGRLIYDFALEAHYAIGSGNHGHSYLCVRDGYVFQMPVSWYSQKGAWDLSPGFQGSLLAGRPVPDTCLFCHANRVELVKDSRNRYHEPVFRGTAIGCERCHGPGELHVQARQRGEVVDGEVDPTIVNPKHLEPTLRDAVCEQCHLAGEIRIVRRGRQITDYRPGLPLWDFLSVFVSADREAAKEKAVNHVEQFYLSRCFRESKGKLACTSCHDPHVRVGAEQRVAHYRAACLACHQDRGCSLPRQPRLRQQPDDSCIACHMPRYASADIPHTAATNHRIVREKPALAPPPDQQLPKGRGIPLRPFYRDGLDPNDLDTARDLALALVGLAEEGKVSDPGLSVHVVRFLEAAVAHDPEDWDAWEGKAKALQAQGRWADALADMEKVLAKAPQRELALILAGLSAENLKRRDEALDYCRRAVEANPWLPAYRQHVAVLLGHKEAWEEALAQCDAWLRLDPSSVEGRLLRVTVLLQMGKKDDARAEFDRVRALRPANLPQLIDWFEREWRGH